MRAGRVAPSDGLPLITALEALGKRRHGVYPLDRQAEYLARFAPHAQKDFFSIGRSFPIVLEYQTEFSDVGSDDREKFRGDTVVRSRSVRC